MISGLGGTVLEHGVCRHLLSRWGRGSGEFRRDSRCAKPKLSADSLALDTMIMYMDGNGEVKALSGDSC